MHRAHSHDRPPVLYVDFDILGRVTRSIQETDNVRYGDGGDANHWMTYNYNLSGALIEQQYPSGRVVRNTLDTNGDLKAVLGSKRTHPQLWAYANGFKYNAAGAVTSMQLGNGNWESTTFNERLQPTQIALRKTQNATDLLELDYQYGDLEWNGSVRPASNNGNVAKQTITVQNVGATPGFTAVQNYDYDHLNRIQIASETLTPTTGTPESWVQEFKYDRYGNRKFNEQTTTTLPKECGTAPNKFVCPDDPKINPSANPNDNKLISYSFDASGNTTRDAQNRKFTYDAENKQTKVETVVRNPETGIDTVTGKVGEYFYDGGGKRIKKLAYENQVLTEETIFLYDASGKLIGEYSNEVASEEDAKIAYLTNDHLASSRINTGENGAVTARHDYHPFGNEIGTSRRIGELGYAGDSVRKQFAAYERDNESELDFAQARYYGYHHGRFISPDPLGASAYRIRPQSWNRYSYSYNSPYKFTDPTGMIPEWVKNTDGAPLWVPHDEYIAKETEQSELPLWTDTNNLTYTSTEGVVELDSAGPSAALPQGWKLDGVAVGASDQPAVRPAPPGDNNASDTATSTPPLAMRQIGDPGRNWYLMYSDIHERRSRGQALFPDSRGLDADRHRWATRQTSLQWGTGTARTFGALNEVQGFLRWDLVPLIGDLARGYNSGVFTSTRQNWAFQRSDLQHNELGISEAITIMNQPKNNVPK